VRKAGLPMQRVRPAVEKLNEGIGLDHALASRGVSTNGALAEVIRRHLQGIVYDADGWAVRLRLPAYTQAVVTVDPTEAFGQPVVAQGGARVEDLVDRFKAGDGVAEVAADFDVTSADVEDVIRVALRVRALRWT
jgi:uncharacterized protein (DUF433 family)